VAEEHFDAVPDRGRNVRWKARRRPYALRVRTVDLLSASSVMVVCAVAGLAAGGVALATPPLPAFVSIVVLVPTVLVIFLFCHRPAVFEVNGLGLRFGLLAWAAAIVVRLLAGDGGMAVFAAPLLVLGGVGFGVTGMRRWRPGSASGCRAGSG